MLLPMSLLSILTELPLMLNFDESDLCHIPICGGAKIIGVKNIQDIPFNHDDLPRPMFPSLSLNLTVVTIENSISNDFSAFYLSIPFLNISCPSTEKRDKRKQKMNKKNLFKELRDYVMITIAMISYCIRKRWTIFFVT